MLILSHLNYDLPVLRMSDSVSKTQKTLRANGINALAVVEKKQYIGLVTEETLAQAISPEQTLADLQAHFSTFQMEEEEDVLASLPWFDNSTVELIAITNPSGLFSGYLTKSTVGNLLLKSGLEQTISLAELTDVCSQITGNTISISQTAENRPGDIPIYVTDNTKITEFSGWRPEITVPTLLSEVYDWFKQDEAMLKPILS